MRREDEDHIGRETHYQTRSTLVSERARSVEKEIWVCLLFKFLINWDFSEELILWLNERLIPKLNNRQKYMDHAKTNINVLKNSDPLVNWYRNRPIAGPIFERIQSFAASVSSMVHWSLLIEPGRLRTHLSVGFYRNLKNYELNQFYCYLKVLLL